jgi:hypothetical protein
VKTEEKEHGSEQDDSSSKAAACRYIDTRGWSFPLILFSCRLKKKDVTNTEYAPSCNKGANLRKLFLFAYLPI